MHGIINGLHGTFLAGNMLIKPHLLSGSNDWGLLDVEDKTKARSGMVSVLKELSFVGGQGANPSSYSQERPQGEQCGSRYKIKKEKGEVGCSGTRL